MRFILACIGLVLPLVHVLGQQASPGHVRGAHTLMVPHVSNDSLTLFLRSWSAHSDSSILLTESISPEHKPINFHPVPRALPEEVSWVLSDSLPSPAFTIFMVERSEEAEEQALFMLESADTGRFVLTTQRAAHLAKGMHLTNGSLSTGPVRVLGYAHHEPELLNGPSTMFRLAQAPAVPQTPAPAFTGAIPEMLFYDRMLTPKERARLSSYLAIKYGITLTEEDYVASDQTKVWAHRTNGAFGSNIFAIARDTASMLDQRQSTSSNEPGFLTLARDTITRWNHQHPARLPDKHYLIAGDDGKPRTWAARQPGQAQYSSRTWHVQRTGDTLLTSVLRLDPAMMQNHPEVATMYWLAVDRTGTGVFAPGTTEFLPFMVRAGTGEVDVPNMFWDLDASGADRFRLAAGGSFIPVTWLEQPICDPPTPGVLTVQAPGGETPIRVSLSGIDHPFTGEWEVSAHEPTDITGIEPGEYDLRITDNSDHVIMDRIWVQPKDAPKIPIAGSYELVAAQQLVLDAQVDGDQVLYEWMLDGGVVGDNSRLIVEKPGMYTCTVVADGCPARATTNVTTLPVESALEIGVMPNPSLTGDVVVQVALPEVTDAELMIVSMQGHVLSRRTLKGQDFHHVQLHVPGPGQYIVSVRTSDGQRSARVIVL